MNLAGSTALVTGANRGLGRHLARELLERGAVVYAGARRPDTVDVSGAIPIYIDITYPASITAAAAAANGVTVLVNNAGSPPGTGLLDDNLDVIRADLDVHYLGTLSMVRAFAPVIETNGGGTILNVLSVLSWLSLPDAGAYCAAKAAEWSMTNTLRVQLADRRIRVAGLHVAYIDTDMTVGLQVPKTDPAQIAVLAVDGIEHDSYEIIADPTSRQVLAGLSAASAPSTRTCHD